MTQGRVFNWVGNDVCVWRDLFICVTWLIHTCDMTYSSVWHDSGQWIYSSGNFIHLYLWYDSFMCLIWLIRICDMTHSHVWHDWGLWTYMRGGSLSTTNAWLASLCVWYDSFVRVTWLIHVCDVTHAYVWRDSFVFVTWLIHMCDMTQGCGYTRVGTDPARRTCD